MKRDFLVSACVGVCLSMGGIALADDWKWFPGFMCREYDTTRDDVIRTNKGILYNNDTGYNASVTCPAVEDSCDSTDAFAELSYIWVVDDNSSAAFNGWGCTLQAAGQYGSQYSFEHRSTPTGRDSPDGIRLDYTSDVVEPNSGVFSVGFHCLIPPKDGSDLSGIIRYRIRDVGGSC